MKYCAVNLGNKEFVIGETKQNIVAQIYEWHIDEERVLTAKPKYYLKQKLHSYSKDWSIEEIEADVVVILFHMLHHYGWTTFINYKNR